MAPVHHLLSRRAGGIHVRHENTCGLRSLAVVPGADCGGQSTLTLRKTSTCDLLAVGRRAGTITGPVGTARGHIQSGQRWILRKARIVKSIRNARNAVAINFNRLMQREFIPRRAGLLNIETSSVCNLKCCFCAYPKKHSPKLTMSDAAFANYVGQALDMGYRRF